MQVNKRPWWRAFLDGMGQVLVINPEPMPSYEERFGTDEELLAEDWSIVQQTIANAKQDEELLALLSEIENAKVEE